MKKKTLRAAAAALLALSALAAAALATSSCSVDLNPDLLDAVNPPAHQLRFVYGDNDFTDVGEVTLKKTYTAQGEAETLTLTNRKKSAITLTSIVVRDTDRFKLTLPSAVPVNVEAGASYTCTVSFTSDEEGSFTTPVTIAYIVGGKARQLKITLKATRTFATDGVAIISVLTSANAQVTSGDPVPYNFGYSSEPIDRVFTIKNSGGNPLVISNIICSNESDYSIQASPVGTIGPGSSAILTIRRNNGKLAASATVSIISNAVNSPSFRLNVSSENFASGSLTVLDPQSAVFTEGVSPCYDLGYSATPITRTFTLRNTGVGALTVYSLSSSNAASVGISEGPAPSETIAEGAQRTFTLSLGAASPATTATITITTSDPVNSVFLLPVSGGDAALNVNFAGKVPYRLSQNCYDFGWCAGAMTKNIVLTNNAPSPLVLDHATLSVSGRYVVGTLPASIPSGGSANVPITFTPLNTTTWSETVCTLYDAYGRTFALYLTGSGFRQPSDIGVTPALWLRADRISSSNIVNVDSQDKVDLWPDVSGNGYHAQPFVSGIDLLRPIYSPGGINGFPSLKYGSTFLKECMRVVPSGNIVNTTTGTTTFIVFRTATAVDNARYLLYPLANTTAVYPQLSWNQWYYDTSDGYYADGNTANRATKWRLSLYGYNNVTRHPADSATTSALNASTTYAVAMMHDVAPVSPAVNIRMSINNQEKTLGFLYSNNSATTGVLGAFGLPVGDGVGNKRAGTNAEDWANNAACAPATYFFNRINASSMTFNSYISSLYIGGSPSGTSNFYGEIAEVIVFATPLDDTNYGYVNAYLCNKYGL